MMICRFPDFPVYRIHPCVEINLRMNMGVVARHIYDRYIYPVSTGAFQISYYPSEGAAWSAHKEMEETYPLEIEQGRIKSGYLPLVPVHKKVVIGRGFLSQKAYIYNLIHGIHASIHAVI